MIEIVRQQQDELVSGRWHFKIGGLAVGGEYRTADLIRDGLDSPSEWLDANQVEAQALIETGESRPELAERIDLRTLGQAISSEIAYLNTTILLIDTMTTGQVRDVVKRLAQENRQILKAMRVLVRMQNDY